LTPSPLELLHPTGTVERVLVTGAGCPRALLPPAAEHADAQVGLVIVAPTAAQLARRGWLAESLARAATAVAADGLVYALLPPAVRAAARRRLRAAGLELATPVAQLPPRSPRYLVPLQARPLRHMLGEEIGAHPRVRRALLSAGRFPAGTRLLAASLPGAALVARRPGAAPLAEWLARLGGETRATAQVAALTSWRGPDGPVVLYCFADGDAHPWGVAKVGPASPREAEQLELLGEPARAAGARVPRLLARGTAGRHPALVEGAVGGRPAARVLRQSPERLAEVAGRIAAWLERWNAATARRGVPAAGRIERELLGNDLLRNDLPASYRDWLADRCAALAGTAVPLVAAHHDLTMWNVRLDDGGRPGVLDWAEAESEALPLTDLFYAVADAAAACDGYRDRVAAARAPIVEPLAERLSASLELSPAVAELCLHASWLRHAGNERRAGGADRPFAEIARWLAHRAGGVS
jgi:hypothetical protein